MKKIACIGSREVNGDQLRAMKDIGQYIAEQGWTVASGNCEKSDQAYAEGANRVNPGLVQLYLPWATYERQAIVTGNQIYLNHSGLDETLAEKHHPNWGNLSYGVKKLMTRNVAIVRDSKAVIAYLNHGKKGGGGTGHGWRVAQDLGIKCLDLSLFPYSEFKENAIRFLGEAA